MNAPSKRQPRRRMAVNVLVLADRFATVAEATMVDEIEGGVFVATGSAKKERGDVYDPVIDVDLAVGRAMVELGEQMIHGGKRAVRAAMEEQLRAAQERGRAVVKTRLAPVRPSPRHAKDSRQLTIEQIRNQFGDEAAQRAASRRQPLHHSGI